MRKPCPSIQWQNLGFVCDNYKVLTECKWTISTFSFLVYRLFIALYVMYALGVLTSNSTKYFVYFTNWTYTLIVINFTVKAIVVLKYYPFLKNKESVIPSSNLCLLKLSWLLTNITTSTSILVSIVFWAFLAPYQPHLGYADVHSHALNTVVVIVDFMFISIPCHASHVYQPLLYSFCYFVFTGIYWAAGGTNNRGQKTVYAFLDWDNPVKIVKAMFGVSFALIVIYLIFVFLDKLKTFIEAKLASGEQTQNDYQLNSVSSLT